MPASAVAEPVVAAAAAPTAPIETPEQVLTAVAPTSFNLPTLPPIPAAEAATDDEFVSGHADASPAATEAKGEVHLNEETAIVAAPPVSEPVAHTPTIDVSASTSQAHETMEPAATLVEAIEATTSIDFQTHLDVSPKIEPVAQVDAVQHTVITTEAKSTVETAATHSTESETPAPQPAQGDLLAHAGIASPQVDEAAHDANADAEHVKKDASSHG